MSVRRIVRGGAAAVALLVLFGTAGSANAAPAAGSGIGADLSLWWAVPFAGMLLSIAIGPVVDHHWFEKHYPKVTLFWTLAFAVPFLIVFAMDGSIEKALYEISHIYLADYIPFIILLGGLFIASGGIVLRGTLVGTPAVNVGFIAVGSLLASLIGTTGASMLLIRPLLRANAHRKQRLHIVIIFIFLVSNIGGSLTPLGDPPLFLGFLHGVPFEWTLSLLPQMLFVIILVLLVFFFWDKRMAAHEEAHSPAETTSLSIAGGHNFLYLLGIMGAVLMSGLWRPGYVTLLGVDVSISSLLRDALIIGISVLAIVSTKKELRDENSFTWEPIREVGILFAGIFMTIIPALAILKAGDEGALAPIIRAASSETAYFWLTGVLSSFLDNAPTYLTFFNTALGKLGLTEPMVSEYLRNSPLPWFGASAADPALVQQIMENAKAGLDMSAEQLGERLTHFESFLKAISMGAVFMGANSYIGNAPNFMVRSIAIQDGVKMPSFFGYMGWAAAILLPIFILVTALFIWVI